MLGLVAVAGLLAVAGCKKRQASHTAANEKSEPQMPTSALTAPLEDTYWALIELGGTRVEVKVPEKAPFLELSSKKRSAYGFGGCNRFFGSYESDGESLTFGSLGATRMACPEGMDREQELFTVLGSVTRYEIEGPNLSLIADKTVIARFEARPRPPE